LSTKLDHALAILNGFVGDHLVRTDNGLATALAWMHEDAPVALERASIARALPSRSPKIAVFVHGLMCTESVWKLADGSDYGALLERDLGYTPIRLRYNSGRAIAENGEELATMLESLLDAYPVPIEEVLLVGYSMGGLVVRAASHTAKLSKQRWLSRVRRAIYVATPHRGTPLERAGRVLTRVLRAIPDPYTRLIADIADVRSVGIKDLADLSDPRHPVPLLPEIQHYLVAGALSMDPRLALLFGDVLVPIPSATADACIDVASVLLPPDHVKIFRGYSHVRLAHDEAVYAQIRAWCEDRQAAADEEAAS
jgi:triacylglycerol lipase